MTLMHGYLDRGHGHGTHAICDATGEPLEMTKENVEGLVSRWNYFEANPDMLELLERNRLLTDIALSALALKINIEYGFTPRLYSLDRDLGAFMRRFGAVV